MCSWPNLRFFLFCMPLFMINSLPDEALAHALRVSALEQNEKSTQNETFKQRLLKNIDKVNMSLRRDVVGDGNCFYYCVIDQMKRLGMDSASGRTTVGRLRTDVVSYLSNLVTCNLLCVCLNQVHYTACLLLLLLLFCQF